MAGPVKSSDMEPPREWWDDQFARNWERNGGPAQTRHFMEQLIAGLGDAERQYLRRDAATVLDWGCAMGDGVEILAQAFPSCKAAGLDVAASAIEAARRRFPARRFVLTERGEIEGRHDVIVTSNCLEHFHDPMAQVRLQLAACDGFYAALVPYREFPRISGHFVTLSKGSFPECAGGFVRISERVLAMEPKFWNGYQLLVVFGSESFVARRPEAALGKDPSFWRTYFEASPAVREAMDQMAEAAARSETRRGELEAERGHLEHRLEQLDERERGIAFLQQEVRNRDDTIAQQAAHLAALEAELRPFKRPAPSK